MQKYCPGATVNELDLALADLANATTTIVSYVRSHPSVKYVVTALDAPTIGLPGALAAAGLANHVKLVGEGATPTNVQYLHSGQQAADVAFPYYEAMWSMVNAVVQKAGRSADPGLGGAAVVVAAAQQRPDQHGGRLPGGAQLRAAVQGPVGDELTNQCLIWGWG